MRSHLVTLLITALLLSGCSDVGSTTDTGALAGNDQTYDAAAPSTSEVESGEGDDTLATSDTDATSATAPEGSAATPTITSPPVAPDKSAEKIVVHDETAALNMLTIGVRPDITLTSLSSEVFVPIAEELGLETAEFTVAEPNIEFLAALEPDRIIALGNPFVVSRLEVYETIAPTTVIPVEGDWQTQVTVLGEALGVQDEVREVITRSTRRSSRSQAESHRWEQPAPACQ